MSPLKTQFMAIACRCVAARSAVAIAFCVGLLPLAVTSAQAQTQTQAIDWLDVPGTNIVSETNPTGRPAMIGRNTIARSRDSINFDASIESEYVRYAGNCRTLQLFRLRTGGFDATGNPTGLASYPGETWFEANPFQARLLRLACSVSQRAA